VSTITEPGDLLSFAVADLTDDGGWDAAVEGVDYVLHVASPLWDESSRDPEALIVPARDGALRVLRAATAAGVKRVVMTSAANAASPSSYAEEGVTDETLWTDIGDPTLSPYRRSKTVAEKAAWDFIARYDGPTTLTTILPGAVFGPILTTSNLGSVRIVARMIEGENARHSAHRTRDRRCPRPGRPPHPCDGLAGGRRTTLPRHRRVHLDV
jgi:nucleoside-diphosphate-sugar epimerase